MGLKQSLLDKQDLRTEEVFVEAWGETLTVRELGLAEGVALARMYGQISEEVQMTAEQIAQVVVWGVVDPETGGRLFSDEDVPMLAGKNQKALMQLFMAVTKLATLTEEGIEEAEKN